MQPQGEVEYLEHGWMEPGELRATGSDELDARPTDRAGDAVEGLVDDSNGQGPELAPEAPPRNGFASWTPLRSEGRPWLDPDEEAEPEVEVRGARPIEVTGRDRLALTRAKALETIVYLRVDYEASGLEGPPPR